MDYLDWRARETVNVSKKQGVVKSRLLGFSKKGHNRFDGK